MGVVLEVRVFPLIAAVAPMTVGEYSCRWIRENDMFQIGKNSIGHCGWWFRPFAAKRWGPRERATGWLTPDFHGAGAFRGSAVIVSIPRRGRRNHRELRFLLLQGSFAECIQRIFFICI